MIRMLCRFLCMILVNVFVAYFVKNCVERKKFVVSLSYSKYEILSAAYINFAKYARVEQTRKFRVDDNKITPRFDEN